MNAVVENLIRKTPGVMGGEVCVGNSRIAVWNLVQAKRSGLTDAQLRDWYTIPLTDDELTAAWAYYAWNREEIEEVIRRNEED